MPHCLPAFAEASGDGLYLPPSVLHGEMERWMRKQHIVALRIVGSRAFIYVRSVIGRDAGNFRLQSQERCKRCVQGAAPPLPCGVSLTAMEHSQPVGNAVPRHRESDSQALGTPFPAIGKTFLFVVQCFRLTAFHPAFKLG